ncbi:MAG TPA: MetS family NSS transporter small subunit [Vicinamibacteria bacterium]|nr:MetS family NSS transporter small subunit [Vicinamibacteria bacterium]
METSALVTMFVIVGGIWGGFAYFLYQNVKRERDQP